MLHRFTACLALAGALTLPTAPLHAEEQRDNVVNLQVELVRTLPNDVLTASLFVEDNDSNPQRLSERINARLNSATQLARSYKAVKVATGALQTWPVYSDKNKLTGWRTRATLTLNSRDFAAAQKLIGELQALMMIENVGFSVSPEARAQQENALIGEALSAFRERAALVQQGFGARGWKVVNVNLSTSGGAPERFAVFKARAMVADAAPAPELAAGESELRMQVNGSIQLTP